MLEIARSERHSTEKRTTADGERVLGVSSISPERWRQIEPILERALELDGEARGRYLDRACGGDRGLRTEVEALLAAVSRSGEPLPGSLNEYYPTLEQDAVVAAKPEPTASSAPGSGVEGRYPPGTLLAGRFRILTWIGRGGMGEVYRAEDLKLGQPVALKFLPPEAERDPDRLDRFRNEVRMALKVTHPNVTRIHDLGEVDGHHYISMQYVDGEDLSSLLRRIGRLPRDKAVQVARQLCAGLAAAHDEGILHRDLKPANVMIDGRGQVKITDFGLAAPDESVTGAEALAGTPQYMAPEQWMGGEVSGQSDLYSLGLVLYELFTGESPFGGMTPAEIAQAHRDGTPTTRVPSTLVEGLDPEIERVILRCLESDPSRRPASALSVSAALPGGDPLAAALAAGETPSPEMVAQAAGTEGLRPAAAIPAVVLLALALVWVALSSGSIALLSRIPWELKPDELERRAQEVLALLGGDRTVLDTAHGFKIDDHYGRRSWSEDDYERSWADPRTALPTPGTFWYRESPAYLVPFRVGVRTRIEDPPLRTSGDVVVELDSRGRLLRLCAVPSRPGETTETATAVDWLPFLQSAGVDATTLQPVEPERWPSVRTDDDRAWRARMLGDPDAEVRVEVASYRGSPVYFELVPPWALESELRRLGIGGMPPVVGGMFLLIILCSIPLARRNLRLGKADRRGAYRLAVFGVMARMTVWALEAHHVPAGLEVRQVFVGLLYSTFQGGAVPWLLYLAMEPFVRRLWPESLTSWTRLLDGRFRDPVVGRHLLLGALAGSLVSASLAPVGSIFRWLGGPRNWTGDLVIPQVPIGLPAIVAHFLDTVVSCVFNIFILTVLFLLFRLLLGKRWAPVVFLSVVGGVLVLAGGQGVQALNTGFVMTMLLISVVALALVRLGLLAAVTAYNFSLVPHFPFAGETSSWLLGQTILSLALFFAIGLWAFYASLGGRPLLDWGQLEESST